MVLGSVYIGGSRHRRAASMPAEDLRPSVADPAVLNKAYTISSQAVQDADAMTAASRKHDRNFINDVNNKLAAASAPRLIVREPPTVYIGTRYPAPPPVPVYYGGGDYRRRPMYAPPVSDYEVVSYLAGGPSRPYSRHSRAESMPPPVVGAAPPRSYPPTVIRAPSVPRWTNSGYNRPYNRASLAPYEDVVVGVAHTSGYGDIVIGIPYSKRHMFDSEVNNYLTGNNHFKPYTNLAKNRYSVATNSPYVPAPVVASVPPRTNYRRASVAVPAYKKRSFYDDEDEIISTMPPRHRASVRRYEPIDVETDWKPPASVSSLRGRAQSVQRQLDGIPEYRAYNPSRSASTAPTTSSGIYGGGYGGSKTGGSSVGGSLPPSSGGLREPPKRTKPPMSEARRKVRDLLCRSKNDPHYFDD